MMSTLNLLSTIDYHKMLYSQLKLLCRLFPDCEMVKYPLEVDTFKKPNTKVMHAVFYSLIHIISPEKCRALLPWPIIFNADTYKFKSGVFKFIEEEFIDFKSPKIAYSIINTASGDRFVQFLCRFCLHAMKLIIQKHYGYEVLDRVMHLTGVNKRLIQELTYCFEIEEKKKQEEFDKNFPLIEQNIQSMLEELSITEKQVERETTNLREIITNIPDCSSCNKNQLMNLDNEEAILDWFEKIRSLHTKLVVEQIKIVEDINLVNSVTNLLEIRNDLLKIRLDGFEVDIDISDYVSNLVEMQNEDIAQLLYTDSKLSLEKLLSFGLTVGRKHISSYPKLEPPEKYYNLTKVLKDNIASCKDNISCFDELNNEIKDYMRKKTESINYLRNKKINNMTEHDVSLYATVTSWEPNISFTLSNDYARSIPGVIAYYDTEQSKCSLKVVENEITKIVDGDASEKLS